VSSEALTCSPAKGVITELPGTSMMKALGLSFDEPVAKKSSFLTMTSFLYFAVFSCIVLV